jgi:hypothetical protein
MNSKNLLLLIALLLIAIGIFKPNLNNFLDSNRPSVNVVDNLDLVAPSSDELLTKSKDIIKALSSNSDRKIDGKRLASLYNDMATLISLDGENEVIKNTEDIRQANRLAGLLLRLDIKSKYPDLPEAAKALIVQSIGDDNVLLNKELRENAVNGFKALAWACNEGSK